MFFRSHFLSERTQTALLVLYALRRSYLSRGGGISKKDIVALTGFSTNVTTNFLSHLVAMKLVDSHVRKFYPGAGLSSASLYDLIDYMDGWVHLGNANLEGITGNIPDRMYLAGCEIGIRKGIYDYLKSIRLMSLLPGAEEAVSDGSWAALRNTGTTGIRDGKAAVSGKHVDPSVPVRKPGRPKRSGIPPEIRIVKEGFR